MRLDPARLVWREFQPKLPQPFPEILQEAIGFRLVLKPTTAVIRVSDSRIKPSSTPPPKMLIPRGPLRS